MDHAARPRLAAVSFAAVSLLAGAIAGCGRAGDAGDGRLLVFAASSLTEVAGALETEFERSHPGVDVVVNVGGSSSLAAQIEQGAPADVFVAADDHTMARVADGAAGAPVKLARNRLTIAVGSGNPHGIDDLADLADPDLVVVVAAPEVPAGAYAAEALAVAGAEIAVSSYEQSVRAVAAKVALGEADAGLVYATDVIASDGRLAAVPLSNPVVATYPIVTVSDGDLAREFVALATGPVGAAALRAAGFEVP